MRTKLRHISTLAMLAFGLHAGAQTARVQVIHNSADAGAALVDIYVNDGLAIDDFGFRTATPFIDLPAGTPITVGVAPGNSMGPDDIIADFPLGSLADGGSYVIMATGLLDPLAYNPFEAFTLNVFPMGQEAAMQAGNTDVLVYHGSTDAPVVDVIEVGVGAGQIIDGMAYGDFAGSMYLELPTLDFILDVTLDNGTPTGLQYEAPLASLGLDGAALVVFASGFLDPANNNDGEAFGLWVALPDGTTLPLPEWNPTANVQVIHNSADALAAEVDVYINGGLAIDNFAFRAATSFLELPAYDLLQVGIAPGNSQGAQDIIATFDYNLGAGETYVIVATGLLDNMNYNPFEAFTLNVFPMGQQAAMQAGNTDVLVYHGSTDAPVVDVIEVGVGAGQIIDGMAYGDFAGGMYLELPTLDFILDVTLDNGTPTGLQYEAPLASLGLEGAALVVFASGFLNPANNNDGEAFGLWVALPDGTTLPLPEWNPTANVQVIHNSADALAAEVDVYINGGLAIDNFAFRTATPFQELPAYDLLQVGIAPGNSQGAQDIIATFDYNLGAGETYVIVANGLLDAFSYDPFIPFDLYVFAPGQTESGDNTETDILAFHGSTDAPTVDLFEVGIGAGQLADDLAYGSFGGYLELATDDYYVQIRLSDGVTPVVTYQAPLESLVLEGAAGVVFASGFLNPANNNDGEEFGLFVAFPDGTVVPLPALGTASDNNVCTNAAPVAVNTAAECPGNEVTGTLENAWNDFGVPSCELPGILPNVFYTFNSGNWEVITVDINAMGGSGPEYGILVLNECGEVAEEIELDGNPGVQACVYNASVVGPVDLVGFTANSDYTLMVYSNLDFANVAGEFDLCLSGSNPSNISESEVGNLVVYPNPNNGTFAIDFDGSNGNAVIDILDLSGKLVWSETKALSNGGRIEVSLDLSPGLYLARLQDAEGVVRTTRLIVE